VLNQVIYVASLAVSVQVLYGWRDSRSSWSAALIRSASACLGILIEALRRSDRVLQDESDLSGLQVEC